MDKLSKEKKVKTTHLFKEFPHSYVILFVILIIMAIATHIIPAGEFNKIQVGGKTVAEAGSFHFRIFTNIIFPTFSCSSFRNAIRCNFDIYDSVNWRGN